VGCHRLVPRKRAVYKYAKSDRPCGRTGYLASREITSYQRGLVKPLASRTSLAKRKKRAHPPLRRAARPLRSSSGGNAPRRRQPAGPPFAAVQAPAKCASGLRSARRPTTAQAGTGCSCTGVAGRAVNRRESVVVLHRSLRSRQGQQPRPHFDGPNVESGLPPRPDARSSAPGGGGRRTRKDLDARIKDRRGPVPFRPRAIRAAHPPAPGHFLLPRTAKHVTVPPSLGTHAKGGTGSGVLRAASRTTRAGNHPPRVRPVPRPLPSDCSSGG
jgi:hypothetical protein